MIDGWCRCRHMSLGPGGGVGRAADAEQQTAGDTDTTQAWAWGVRVEHPEDAISILSKQQLATSTYQHLGKERPVLVVLTLIVFCRR